MPKQTVVSRYHHGNLRQSFIDAACEYLKHASAESLSLRELAREIGVSQTAHYRHFKSKNALFAAIAIDGFELLHKVISEAQEKHDEDFSVTFTEVGLAYVNWAITNPEKYQMLHDSLLIDIAQYPALLTASKQSFEDLTNLIEKGIAIGFFIPRPVPELAGAMWVCVHGIASLLMTRSKMLSAADVDNPAAQAIEQLSQDPRATIELLVQSIRR